MQNLIVIGNLGADAEVRVVNDRKFVSFKVADTQRFTDNKGVTHDSTVWISCAWNSDGGNLLPYLKRGTKVMVIGRPSYKVYSSAKERMMMAGVDLHVVTIELAGGSSEDVPKRLVDPSSGQLVETRKFYWVQGFKNCQLVGERGGLFNVDAQGFVFAVRDEQQGDNNSTSQQAEQQAETAANAEAEAFGEQTEEAQKVANKKTKANAKNK